MSSVWNLKLKGPLEALSDLADLLIHGGDERVYSCSLFDMDRRESVLDILVGREQDAQDLAAPFEALGDVTVHIEKLPRDKDWVSESQSYLPPVTAGRFWVHGSHDKHLEPGAEVPLLIDAGEAFGTGHHATTAGCLKAFDQLLGKTTPSQILDLGCGAGTLAIAAAKVLNIKVKASDIDEAAVRVTLENAETNGVGSLVDAFEVDGLGDPRLQGPFDLVFANILAGPLIEMSGDIARVTAPGGYVILSGLLESQTQRVLDAFTAAGLKLDNRSVSEDWATLTLTK